MKVNYVLMYGTPYVKYREFEKFEDISKFLVNKSITNYKIFKALEDKDEVEMIYRDNDINYLEDKIKIAKSRTIILINFMEIGYLYGEAPDDFIIRTLKDIRNILDIKKVGEENEQSEQ